MPCILTFEDKVYFDTASDVYHAAANLKQHLCLEGQLGVDEDTGTASIGRSPIAYKYLAETTLVADLSEYMKAKQ